MRGRLSEYHAAVLVALLLLCGTGHAQEGSIIWAAWSQHVKGLLNPSNDKGMDDLTQIVASPLPLHWDDKLYGHYEFCRFANSIPKPGLIYEPSGSVVYQQYQTFVQSIDVQASAGQSAVANAVRQAENPIYLKTVKGKSGDEYPCPEFTYTPQFNQLESQSSRNKWELGREQYSAIDSSIRARIRIGSFVRSSAQASHLRLEADDIVKIVIEYSLSRVVIQPGPWFSGILIELFKQGPFRTGSVLKESKFFGVDGVFPWLPREAVIALRPKVIITLSPSAYAALKQNSQAIQSVDIGPFRFGDTVQESTISLQDGAKTLTLENNASTPFLIAIVNKAIADK